MDRLPFVRRAVIADRSVASNAGWTAVAILVPTALRWVIDKGESGIPFVTYFPAVLLASLLLGWRYGAVTAIVSGVIANRLFREEPLLFYVSTHDALLVLLFMFSCAIVVAAGGMIRRLVREQERTRLREDMLRRELLHRVKNMLVIVQSIASLTARNSDPQEFLNKFTGRLIALDKANMLLGISGESDCAMTRLIEDAVEPFRSGGNISLSGPPCDLPSSAFIPLSLAIHELCTNASKYGALSVPGGKVSIEWAPVSAEADRVRIQWTETGGPKVKPPTGRGMGTLLLRPQTGLKDVKLDFLESGVRCELLVEGLVEPGK